MDVSRLRWAARVFPGAALLIDTILLQATIEGAPAHAQLLCRQPDITVVPGQDFLDEHAFGFLE